MFSAIKIINSKNKRNIRFVAAGSFQIEFFENEGHDYFTIYIEPSLNIQIQDIGKW